MDLFTTSAVAIALTALYGYINVQFLKLPNMIGLMVIAIVSTLVLFTSTLVSNRLLHAAERLIDFQHCYLTCFWVSYYLPVLCTLTSINCAFSHGGINSDSSVYDPQFLSSTLNPGVSSSNENQDEDDSAIAIPEPANILLFGILAFTGMAFAIWHRNSVQKANDAAKNQPAAQE